MGNHAYRKWPQFLMTFLCNVTVLGFGLLVGWLSPLQPSLQSEDTPLGENAKPLTDEEISWIGALPSVTLTFSSPFFAYLMDKYGRKMALFVATTPNLLTYILLIFADNVYMIYASRLIGGFCCAGGFAIAPIYVSEICETQFRGLLCGSVGAFINLGIIISFVFGGYTSYLVLNLVSVMFTVFFLLCYIWMPESPVYCMMKNEKEKAREALIKLRGNDYALIEKEMNAIQHVLDEANENESNFNLKRFFTSKPTMKALFIVCGAFTNQMLSGYPAIMRYTVDIIQESGTNFSAHMAAILVALVQLICSIVSAAILDQLGRKRLILFCTFVMCLSLFLMSSYLFMKRFESLVNVTSTLKLLPTICLTGYISGNAAGYNTVPFLLIADLFIPEAKATACSLVNVWVSFVEFFVTKMFPTITNVIGLDGSFMIFTGACCLGFLFVLMYVFETKGMEFEDIYRKLKGKKKSSKRAQKEGNQELTRLNK